MNILWIMAAASAQQLITKTNTKDLGSKIETISNKEKNSVKLSVPTAEAVKVDKSENIISCSAND